MAVLIMVSGGLNLWGTNSGQEKNRYEIDRAREQINEIHGKIDDFERRQEEELVLLRKIEEATRK